MKNIKSLVLFFSLFFSAQSFSATTGLIELHGTVATVLSLSVAPEAIASSLNLHSNATDLKVATISEQSNSDSGYKILISSLNSGNLKRSGGTEVFAYTLKYNNQAVNLAAPAQISRQTVAGAYHANVDATISYTGVAADNMVAGLYSDTLTLEIAAN